MNNTPLIFENAHFIVANKPAGVNFHDEGNINSGFFNQIKTTCNFANLYPVHRLDKMTSGLIIFAKTREATQRFNQLFSEHDIEKYYLAISHQKPTKKQGWIKGDMEKSRRSSYKLLRTMKHPAISQFFSYSLGQGTRLFLVKPLTGKTHQIRVALKSIGSSIVGDAIYNPSDKADRGYLHAYALNFEFAGEQHQFTLLPQEGELYQSEACVKQLAAISKPWDLKWPKG